MIVFIIIMIVLLSIILAIVKLSATLTLVYDKGWNTRIKVLFIDKEIELSKILSFLMFPEKKAEEVAEAEREKKEAQEKEKEQKEKPADEPKVEELKIEEPKIEADAPAPDSEEKPEEAPAKPKKSNPIKKLWDDEGIVGILSLVSNLLETANSAILTLIRGLHIYSLYVMIIVGGGDAADIAQSYGTLCKYYYPVKGLITTNLKVDNYDDVIQADFIAPRTEFEFQLIASINVGLLIKVGAKAGFIFIKNLIKNKNSK